MPTLNNTATVAYRQQGALLNVNSNTTNFSVIGNDLKVVKSQTPTSGVAGTTVTFTITLTNIGTTTISDIVLTDNLTQAGYTFITGTVTVDGTAMQNANPNNGIQLSALTGGNDHTVIFKATVNTPSSN